MSIPEESEVLGTSSGEVVIRGACIDIGVKLSPIVVRHCIERLTSMTTTQVYLTLENIRGTRDASVLRVYLRVPHTFASTVKPASEVRAGSVGLYGLRRASVDQEGVLGKGLEFTLDVSSFFKNLHVTSAFPLDEIIVSIRPNRELPGGSPVVIGRLLIFMSGS